MLQLQIKMVARPRNQTKALNINMKTSRLRAALLFFDFSLPLSRAVDRNTR